MTEWIITSAVLIVVVVILRQLLKGKISLRLQYALWALVLVRLLVPVSFGQTSFSILNAMPEQHAVIQPAEPEDPALEEPEVSDPVSTPVGSVGSTSPVAIPTGSPIIPTGPVLEPDPAASPDPGTVVDPVASPEPPVEEIPEEPAAISVTQVLNVLWVAGIAMVALWFLVSNLSFWLRLRRSRQLLTADSPIRVYVTGAVETPCLFGLIRPAIYVTPEVAADGVTMHHVLAHELTHHRHWDHIWSVLRCVCLAVHWYNPLVWLAASLSRRDAELACDESTIRRIGEEERSAYGRTLIGLTCVHRSNLLHTATTMTGSKKSIKERIVLIAKKPKMAVYTLIAVILIAAIAVGCTFTGAEEKEWDTVQFTCEGVEGHLEGKVSLAQGIRLDIMIQNKTDEYFEIDKFWDLYRKDEDGQWIAIKVNPTAEWVDFPQESMIHPGKEGVNTWNGFYIDLAGEELSEGAYRVKTSAWWLIEPDRDSWRDWTKGEEFFLIIEFTVAKDGEVKLNGDADLTEPMYIPEELLPGEENITAPAFVQVTAETYIEQQRAAVEQGMMAISVTHEVLSELKGLSGLNLGTTGPDDAVKMWQLDYDITVAINRGQEANTTAHTAYLVFLYDYASEEYTRFLGAVDDETLLNVYNTPEMIGKYSDMYRAAAMELYSQYVEASKELNTPVSPSGGLYNLTKRGDTVSLTLYTREEGEQNTFVLDYQSDAWKTTNRIPGTSWNLLAQAPEGTWDYWLTYTSADGTASITFYAGENGPVCYTDEQRTVWWTARGSTSDAETLRKEVYDVCQSAQADPEADLIAYFQNLLTFDGGESWYNGALTCVYDDPRDMNLSYVFYVPFDFLDDVGWEDFTAEEEAYLISQGFYRELSAQKRHGKQLDAALQQYFGISLSEARIPDGWVYYEGTDSYYSNTNDIHVMEDFTVTKVVQGEDGLVYVHYTATGPIFRQDGTSLDGWEHDMVLTLRSVISIEVVDGYVVVANQTQKEFEDSYSAVGTAVDPAQIVNHILVGQLMYDNSWQSMGSFTLTSTAADGRVDTYVSEPRRFSGLDSTPGGYMAAEYEWTEIDASQWTGLAENEYALTFANDRYSVTVYSGENKLELQANGETRYFVGKPKYESHGDFSNLFNLFRQYAEDALWDHEMAACWVSGSETDYNVIARELAEQYAQIILDRPGWAYGQALDVKVDSIEVTDAYYGTDNPNFCFVGSLPLKVTEQQRWYWETGSGLAEPPASGPYAGYYGYGLGADVKKCEDGNWHMTGMWTGGESVALPVSLDDATVQQLMELYFLTEGKTHDWRIPYRLVGKPLEEVAAQLKQLEPEQRRELTSAIAALIEEYPDYAAWSATEFEVAAMIHAIMGNTEVYRCEGNDPYEAAVELITAYVEDLMVPDDLRTFTITQYRNLTVEIQPTLEMSDAAISRYNYDLSEEEIGENTWIVEFGMEYRWEGVLHGPPCGPSTGVPDDYWESQVHQGSPLGFLLTRNGNEFTLQSRYDTRY